MKRLKRAALVGVAALLIAACGASLSSAPQPQDSSDKELATGRELWIAQCARCHGPAGKGDVGPKLAGVVEDDFPKAKDEEQFVADGKGIMPSFDNRLSDSEIAAVVRYTREVL